MDEPVLYWSRQMYTHEEFLSEPGQIPMVRITDVNGYPHEVCTPEEFELRYKLVPAADLP